MLAPFYFAAGYSTCASIVSLFFQATMSPDVPRSRTLADAAMLHAFGALVGFLLVGILSLVFP